MGLGNVEFYTHFLGGRESVYASKTKSGERHQCYSNGDPGRLCYFTHLCLEVVIFVLNERGGNETECRDWSITSTSQESREPSKLAEPSGGTWLS